MELVAQHLGHDCRRRRTKATNSSIRRWSPWADRSPPAWKASRGWCAWIRSPLAGHPARTSQPTPVCSTHIRKLFAQTPAARARHYDAGRFSFNVAKGRCPNCEGEGFVMVELLFLPSVYAPCPVCHGTRYNAKTLEIKYRGTIHRRRSGNDGRRRVGVLRRRAPRAPLTERSAGSGPRLSAARATGYRALRREAQRIKLATELQRAHAATPCTCSTSPPRACTQRMWKGWRSNSTAWWNPATRSSSSSTTCAWSPAATGSSISGPVRGRGGPCREHRDPRQRWPGGRPHCPVPGPLPRATRGTLPSDILRKCDPAPPGRTGVSLTYWPEAPPVSRDPGLQKRIATTLRRIRNPLGNFPRRVESTQVSFCVRQVCIRPTQRVRVRRYCHNKRPPRCVNAMRPFECW